MVLAKHRVIFVESVILAKYLTVWSYITFFINFVTVSSSDIDLKFLAFASAFFNRGFSFPTLQSSGKWDNFINILWICIIGMAKTSAPFYKKFSNNLLLQLYLHLSFLEDLKWICFGLVEMLCYDSLRIYWYSKIFTVSIPNF